MCPSASIPPFPLYQHTKATLLPLPSHSLTCFGVSSSLIGTRLFHGTLRVVRCVPSRFHKTRPDRFGILQEPVSLGFSVGLASVLLTEQTQAQGSCDRRGSWALSLICAVSIRAALTTQPTTHTTSCLRSTHTPLHQQERIPSLPPGTQRYKREDGWPPQAWQGGVSSASTADMQHLINGSRTPTEKLSVPCAARQTHREV